jgi:iron complex transport system ATP-binding protein
VNHAEPQLAVRGLDVSVAGRTLVAQLALTIRAGQTTVVLGCNGSGKTLCLLSLAGLRGATAATVMLGGKARDSLSRREVARQLSFMPQDSGTEVVGTVLDFVTLGLYPWQGGGTAESGADQERTLAALQRLDLADKAQQEVVSLSGGERRRLDLALLLVQRTRLWLLDEPTNHLDPAQQAVLLGLLREHRAAGGGALVSLHDPSLAADIADQVLLLSGDGRWECGCPQDMLGLEKLSQLYHTPLVLLPGFRPQAR